MANPIQGYFNSTSFTLDVNGFPIWNMAVGSEFMAKFAHTALGNGAAAVTTGGFQVVKKTGMTVTVKPYFICKDGYMMYQTAETDITFTSSTSEQVFYISARLDVANNHFTGDNIAGYTTFVSATDIAACKLTITANAVTITDGMITDLRYDANYCGQIDEYRERSLELIAELEAALEAALAGGIPAHASTHAAGGADPIVLTSIATVGVDYASPATIAMINGGGVFTGGSVTAQGTPNQTVAVSAGSIITPDGKRYAFDAVASLAATAADATNPRIDIVYASSAGVVTYLAGTAAASPSQPATPSNGTILAAITRAANDNAISTAEIEDQRDFITTANDFEDVNGVTEASNWFNCNIDKKHTRNFSFTISNTTAKGVAFWNVPYKTCDVILTIKMTATAPVTWLLDSRTLVWPAGAPTLTSGFTYEILFSYVPLIGKWIGRAQLGAAN